MRTVIALVLALAATPAFAEDIITQDQVQAVPTNGLDQMRDHRKRLDAALKVMADEEVVERKATLNEAMHMSIGAYNPQYQYRCTNVSPNFVFASTTIACPAKDGVDLASRLLSAMPTDAH